MTEMIFMELGFPICLVNPPMIEVRGELIPDINLRQLQARVFQLLITKPTRFTGGEVRFIRKHLRLRQADLAECLNMANHSVISQWESRQDQPTEMGYNTEVVLRLWMATRSGYEDITGLLESKLRRLGQKAERPLEVEISTAA